MNERSNSNNKIIELNNDLMLFLKWSTRDLIISLIQKYSALLMGKSMTNELKQKLKKENNNLILVLSNLPMKLLNDEQQDNQMPTKRIKLENETYHNSNQRFNEETTSNDSDNSDELFLEIKPDINLKIINHLITNKMFSLSCRSFKNEVKNNLVKQNKQLINELLDLNVSNKNSNLIQNEDHLLFDEQCLDSSNANKTINGTTSTQLVNKNEFNNLIDDFKTEFSEMKSSLRTEMADFRDQFNQFKEDLSEKVKIAGTNQNSVEFTFILDDADNFMKSNIPIYSEFFYCKSLPWCLSFQIMERNDLNRTKFLGFYLRSGNTSDLTNWKCDVEAELKLISQIPNIENNYFGQQYNVVKIIKTSFSRTQNVIQNRPGFSAPTYINVLSYGFNDFIALDKLNDFKNGFVMDNKIKFQVSLNVTRLLRSGFI